MVISISTEFDMKRKCTCPEDSKDFITILKKQRIADLNVTQIKYLKIGGNFCLQCKGFVNIKYKYLIKDILFYNEIDKDFVQIINSDQRIKTFIDKFKKQKFIYYKTAISNLKKDHLKILESFWKGGFFKVYRNKRNPKLTTPSELNNSISSMYPNIFTDKGYQIQRIGLTNQGREFLENFLKWDISSQIFEFKKRINSLITKKLNYFKKIIIRPYTDLRIKKLIEIFENIDFYGRNLTLEKLKLDFIFRFDRCKDIINLITLIVEKINNKEIISLKSVLTDFSYLNKNARSILYQVLNTNLILFNIFPEPFGNISLSNLIYKELQEYTLNFFEPEFKNYIITQLKSHISLEKIWNERIPPNIISSIKGIYYSNGRKYFNKSDLTLENEFNNLIGNHRLEELISHSYFSSIPKIITYHINWEQIFKLEFKHFNDSDEFEENFDEINLIRNKLAHKSKKKFDFLKYLQKHNLILSDILRKYYHYSLPFLSSV